MGATSTAFTVSSCLVPLSNSEIAPAGTEGADGAGLTTEVTASLPFGSTCRLVGVPGTWIAVELVMVLVTVLISVTVFAPASSTRIALVTLLRASAVGRPPTVITPSAAFVVASSAETVPWSGSRTYSVLVAGLSTEIWTDATNASGVPGRWRFSETTSAMAIATARAGTGQVNPRRGRATGARPSAAMAASTVCDGRAGGSDAIA